MTLSQRLRKAMRYTRLDADRELLTEAADEIDALQARAQVQGEPVGFTYQAEIAYADSTGGNGSFWRVPPDLDDEAVPLYTHQAPSVPGDVVRDAMRYEWLRKADRWPCVFPDYFDPEPLAGSELDECVDAAMLAAK